MPILYYLILLPFSRLPYWILYRISGFLYICVYYVFGYRKKVVRINIKNSFPEMSENERLIVERRFYKHFCDLVVESMKAFTISKEEIEKRFIHRNPDIVEKYFEKGQHITLVGGHYGNWELYAVSVAMHMSYQPVALFTPLQNKFMNDKIKGSRSKYGLWMKRYLEVKWIMKEDQQKVAVIFGADQCPKLSQQPHWVQFLNQETGVQFGTERFARDYNTPVVYGVIHKVKRGYYEVEYKLVCENPEELPIGAITEIHTKLLENDIKNDPAYWLWSHKRWKRTRKDFENK